MLCFRRLAKFIFKEHEAAMERKLKLSLKKVTLSDLRTVVGGADTTSVVCDTYNTCSDCPNYECDTEGAVCQSFIGPCSDSPACNGPTGVHCFSNGTCESDGSMQATDCFTYGCTTFAAC